VAWVDRNRLLDALLLDAIGSAAAEAAADALNLALCEVAGARGLFAAPRVSPGYGAWDVRFQVKLLALLPAAELGVTLTTGQMMVPRKSVSFAVSFEQEARQGHSPGSRCERCGLERCRHRIAPMRGA
jgi:cobalamin-dependent methionine synthase I